MEERAELLLSYLNELRQLNEAGYSCHAEIRKAIRELEEELNIIDVQ